MLGPLWCLRSALKYLYGLRRMLQPFAIVLLVIVACIPSALAISDKATELSSSEQVFVDKTVRDMMELDNVPAISLAIVRDGQISYLKAYGYAELPSPRNASGRIATTATRFAIGSVSKEFTAAAILFLVSRGKLSLDDKVAKYLPQLTDAKNITIRELLSHTSGYRDYFLQEYIPARMQQPTEVDSILKNWGERPLDFSPGEEWQYSGTNYVIAGRIVEKVTGEPYHEFLTQNILRPVRITDSTFADHATEADRNAVGYYRFALGPPHPAPLTGRNWLFAMADLEMTAKDIALWDLSIINQTPLSPASYAALSTAVKTRRGETTGYGLGFFVRKIHGTDGKDHLLLHHPGEISGFRSHNFVLPDLKAAVVILTNAEYSNATDRLAQRLQPLVGTEGGGNDGSDSASPATAASKSAENPIETRARKIMLQLAAGTIDRSELTPDASAMFTAQALGDIRRSLAQLGELERVKLDSTALRGGTKHFALTVFYQKRTLQIAEYDTSDGKVEQFFIDGKS